MNNPILEIKNVSKFFTEDFSISDISMNLFAGEVHIVIGENGSGKSSLMKIVMGIFKADSGTIIVDGEEVHFNNTYEAKQKGILYIMQDTNLFYNLSVAENVYYDRLDTFSGICGINYHKLLNDCMELFKNLHINVDVDSNVSQLGLAQKQLIELAKAYVSRAKIIIFDEPSSAFTDVEREVLFHVIKYLKQKGIAIFYISHRLDDIGAIGNRISVLLHGSLVGTKSVSETDKANLIKMMTNKTYEERYPKLDIKLGKEVLRVVKLKSKFVLNNINFSIRKGEIMGISGLIGSGRTYLANCLFGSIIPDSGDIYVNGKLCQIRSTKDSLDAGIIMLPENRIEDAIFENMDVFFNMTISSLKRFTSSQSVQIPLLKRTVIDYIDRFDIKPNHPDSNLKTYSGGNQQKIIISKLIMTRSKIFVLDEPTRGVDIASKVDIYNAMNDIVIKGGTIILISSDIDELLGMCDKIMVLCEGESVAMLDAKEATKEKILSLASC